MPPEKIAGMVVDQTGCTVEMALDLIRKTDALSGLTHHKFRVINYEDHILYLLKKENPELDDFAAETLFRHASWCFSKGG
jgi:hypothetical protein